jgi:hypothetical protein
MKIQIVRTAAVIFALLGAACGGALDGTGYQDIGLGGGEVRAGDTVVSVPEGAVDRTTGFSITPAPTAELPEGAAGPAIDLGPADARFNAPVTIRLRFDIDRLEDRTRSDLVWVGTVVDGEWEPLEDAAVDETARIARGTTRRGGRYGVVYGCGRGRRCPVALQFASAPERVLAGDCSPALELSTVSHSGRVVPVVHDTLVALSSDFENLAYFADARCQEEISALRIPARHSGASFHVRGRVARSAGITAQARDLRPGTHTMTIAARPGVRFEFVTPEQRFLTGACSAQYLVAFLDEYGNRAPVPNDARIILSATARASVTFHSDPRCQTPTSGIVMPSGDAAISFWASADLGPSAQLTETIALNAAVGAFGGGFAATQNAWVYP